MPLLDFSSSESGSPRGHKTKWIVRAGSRINRRLTYEAKAVRVNFTYFSLVIPNDCQVGKMITAVAGKKTIDATYMTDGSTSGGRSSMMPRFWGR